MPKTRVVEIELLKPYWRNPRNITREAIASVKASILTSDYLQYIVVGKDNVIAAGHTRLKAFQSMSKEELCSKGWDKGITVIDASDLPDESVKRFRIMDNAAAGLATWRMDDLKIELREIGIDPMVIHFPQYDLRSFVEPIKVSEMAYSETKDKAVKDAEDKIKDQFTNRVKAIESDMRDVVCPSCGHEFIMSRADFV